MFHASPAKIAIVDPTIFFCDGLEKFLRRAGHVVVGHAHDVSQALALLIRSQPDLSQALALLIRSQPDLTCVNSCGNDEEGFRFCHAIHAHLPHLKLIVFSLYADDLCVQADAAYVGAIACVSPNHPMGFYGQFIAEVLAGKALIPPDLAQPAKPTQREREILKQMAAEVDVLNHIRWKLTAQGLSDQEIEKEFYLAPDIVQPFYRPVLARLGVNTKAEAVRCAERRGWLV